MYYKSIYYQKYGNKNQVILILPGWGNTRETFNNIINYFKENYTIYILDYPGFGKSKTINKELTIYDYASLINEFIQNQNIKNPIIIAHSFGGRITSILNNYIKIKKIILIDVSGIKRIKLKVALKKYLYKLLKLLIKLLPRKKQNYYKEKLFNYFSSPDYKNININMRNTFKNIIKEDLRNYYKNIKVETLIIWGEKDEDTPLKDAYLLNKIISNSGLIILKNLPHYSYLYNPHKINKIIEIFLKEKTE
jgi:pimeloyl-ACP methyl ester carboxylesterase